MIKTEQIEIWEEFQKGIGYNNEIGLYETVKRNEEFFIGKQWEGVRAGNLDKPVLNVLKRVVSYFNSQIVSDDVGISFDAWETQDRETADILAREIERVIEDTKLKTLFRGVIRDASVDGDGILYLRWDPDAPTGQPARGAVRVEPVENRNLYFGNPYSDHLQGQPYLLITSRVPLDYVREEARRAGSRDFESITADSDAIPDTDDSDELVTVVTKLWKERGTVWAKRITSTAVVREVWDTGLTLYPVAMMSWEKVKFSYHGQAAVTAQIQNQISVNKLFAMALQSVKEFAFPKIFYNRNMVPNWSNKLDDAIGVNGDPNAQIYTGFRAPDMSSQVMQVIESLINYTKEMMGASDAALGNVKPDNTSAIIAVQQASAAPLQIQKLAFYQFVEDVVRVLLDMITTYYGRRQVTVDGAPRMVDFSQLSEMNLRLKVDVGAASYWSELTQIQTLDNLFSKGIIADPVTYLENIPSAYVKNKQKIIEGLKEQQMQAAGGQMGEELMAGLTPEEQAVVQQNPQLLAQATAGVMGDGLNGR